MVEPLSIRSDLAVADGLDYASLRAEGLALVQALSGAVWTDYNESDPGVTILEQLCYALTESGYRSGFAIPDLLVDERGHIDPDRHALFVAARIFVCNPVTESDYRKLLVDRVPAVRNAWLEPVDPVLTAGVNGLYRLRVHAPSADPCANTPAQDPRWILDQVEAVYVAHRAVCEDLAEPPTLLVERATRVAARVALAPSAEPNQTMAAIQFAIGSFLAPELERSSLATELARGATPDELFVGPLLEHGFIADAQLQPKLSCFGLRELAGVIAKVPGVVGVSGLELRIQGARYTGNQTVPVGPDEILTYIPACRADESTPNETGLRLFKGRAAVCCDCRRVERRLAQLWAAYRRAYPLADQYESLLGFPSGRVRPLASYTSIQIEFPIVYGINEYGLPSTATVVRRGQAKQLKGYLLAFEQLLADYFAQLASIRQLYSRDRDLEQTYFWRTLCGAVPAVEPILEGGCGPDSAYTRGLAALVAINDPVVRRRNDLVGFLLSMHSQQIDPANTWARSCRSGTEPDQDQLAAKLDLLDVLVASGRDRGRGLDYRSDNNLTSLDSQPGMVLESRIQLGMSVDPLGSFSDRLDELGVNLAAAKSAPTFGRELQSRAEDVRDGLRSVSGDPSVELDDHESDSEAARLRGQTLGAEFMATASELRNYRYEAQGRSGQVTLLCALPNRRWSFVARYPDESSAEAGARRLSELMSELRQRSRQLIIIEHVLLRFALQDEPPTTGEREFEYSFTLTAVIASDVGEIDDPEYREFAAGVIRTNAPAHAIVDLCFLDPTGLVEFELLYWPWRAALTRQDPSDLVSSSRRLREFLIEHRRPESGSC